MKNKKKSLTMTSGEFLKKNRPKGESKAYWDQSLNSASKIAERLVCALSLILWNFDYQNNKKSGMAFACDILGAVINTLAPFSYEMTLKEVKALSPAEKEAWFLSSFRAMTPEQQAAFRADLESLALEAKENGEK